MSALESLLSKRVASVTGASHVFSTVKVKIPLYCIYIIATEGPTVETVFKSVIVSC